MRREPIFLILLAGLFLTGWGHDGPRVTVGFIGDHGDPAAGYRPWFEKELKALNASMSVEGAEALIFMVHDPNQALEQAARAKGKGIPVLSVNRPIPGNSQDFLIAYDPHKEGGLQALGALAIAPKGLYLLAGQAGGDWFRKAFREGQLEVLNKAVAHGDVRISTRSQDLPKAAAVLTFDQNDAGTWSEKISKMGKEGKVVLGTVGQDRTTCKAIAAGRPVVSVYESPVKLAEETAYLATKAARKAKTFDCQFVDIPNGREAVRTVLLTPKVLEAKDLEGTVIKDGVWTREEIYGKK